MTRPTRRPFDGGRLIEVRLASFQTQETIARKLGVSIRSVQRWEQGQSQPQLGQVLEIASLFGREPEWFLIPEANGDPVEAAA